MNQKNIILALAAGLIGWVLYPEKSEKEEKTVEQLNDELFDGKSQEEIDSKLSE